MPTELEAKMKVGSHDPVRERLRAMGSTFVARIFETNRFFDTPAQGLRGEGKGLRLRINHNVDTGTDEAVVSELMLYRLGLKTDEQMRTAVGRKLRVTLGQGEFARGNQEGRDDDQAVHAQ